MSTAMTLDPLGFNMEEVIAALPTQHERDEFTLFLEEHLKRGTGAGILRGMFLLLKANRCYLEKLPGQFNRELVRPMRDLLLGLEKSLTAQISAQSQIAIQNERTTTRSVEVMDRMDSIVPKVENVVQRAVDKVDTKALTQQITATVLESAVEPVRKTNSELLKMADLLAGLIKKAEKIFDLLGKIAWRQILLGSLGVTFAFWLIVFIFAYQGMRHSFSASLQEQNEKLLELTALIPKMQTASANNQQICDELSRLLVTIDVKPVFDGQNHYQLTVPQAFDAKVLPDGTGVISFQGADLMNEILRQIDENRQLSHH